MDANIVYGRIKRCENDNFAGRDQVEMLDVATILRDFSSETLVLVDELGR
jgi:DNA mismatch repair ATPase MutS